MSILYLIFTSLTSVWWDFFLASLAKEARKKSHQTEVKEVKMRYKIDKHDYDVRIGQAIKFLKSGDKVKCTIMFRGREIQHSNLAETLLLKMANDLEEQWEVQQKPKREGRNMIMFLSPRKTPLIKKDDGWWIVIKKFAKC